MASKYPDVFEVALWTVAAMVLMWVAGAEWRRANAPYDCCPCVEED